MGYLRKIWTDAKADAKRQGADVSKLLSGKVDLGPLLDACDTAVKAYDSGMDKLARSPNDAKAAALKKAVRDAYDAAENAANQYVSLLRNWHNPVADTLKTVLAMNIIHSINAYRLRYR
ncbi:hypothetical protein HSX11_02170 [Oxalobacteraceae bacterium]|nr:hypothetical protein [Oxalobacteraceae bacterium]